jgi:hypothetical protein
MEEPTKPKRDLSGMVFGDLTVLCQSDTVSRSGRKDRLWRCICKCGNERLVITSHLTSGKVTHCKLCKKERKVTYDLTGERFGDITVDKLFEHRDGRMIWECTCDCGKSIYVSTAILRSGKKTHCGCKTEQNRYKDFWQKDKSGTRILHGDSKTRLYRIYRGMKQRCNNPNHTHYYCYGGRGIKICDEWELSYMSFKEWAMRNGYQDHLEIDRKNVDGDYCPENCRWITHAENNRNKRNTVRNDNFVSQTVTGS